jgi:hypothetical protein
VLPSIPLITNVLQSEITFLPYMIAPLLKSIKQTSPGPDGLHPIILKNLSLELSVPLAYIFSFSYNHSCLPDIWLCSNVQPIYKNSGSKLSPQNYRPVSITSIICKIMETIIKNAVFKHLEANHLMTNFQHGFYPRRYPL